jgi:hypothetical protein
MKRLLLVALAVAGVYVATRHGPGLSPDSVTYLSAARSLAGGHGFVDFTGQPDTTFAPGFPALLAVVHAIGLSWNASAVAINAASLAGIVVIAERMLRRRTALGSAATVAALLVAISPALLNAADHLWSEPLFCLFLLADLLLLERAACSPRSGPLVFAAGALVGVTCMVRYAGSVIVLVGALVVFLACRRSGFRAVATRTGLFLLGAAPLPVLWIARNAGTHARYLLGPRVPAPDATVTIARRFLTSFADLFVPSTALVPALILGTIITGGLGWIAYTSRGVHRLPPRAGTVLPLAAFVLLYPIFVIASGKLAGASVDGRTVMPIYVPTVLLVARLADCRLRGAGARSRRFNLVATAAMAGLVVGTGAWFVTDAVLHAPADAPAYYGSAASRRSALARVVERLPSRALVATNRPWRLYYITGHEPIVPSPGVLRPAASLVPVSVDFLSDQSCSRPTYLVWYRPGVGQGSPIRIVDETRSVVVGRFRDGIAFAIEPVAGACRAGADLASLVRPQSRSNRHTRGDPGVGGDEPLGLE